MSYAKGDLTNQNQLGRAQAREKEIKGWRRSKKIALIKADNPEWRDVAQDWFN